MGGEKQLHKQNQAQLQYIHNGGLNVLYKIKHFMIGKAKTEQQFIYVSKTEVKVDMCSLPSDFLW